MSEISRLPEDPEGVKSLGIGYARRHWPVPPLRRFALNGTPSGAGAVGRMSLAERQTLCLWDGCSLRGKVSIATNGKLVCGSAVDEGVFIVFGLIV